MNVEIKTTTEEQCAVIVAIDVMLSISHIAYMPDSLIATTANLKATKIRAVINDLVQTKKIKKFALLEDRQRKRYFYTITEQGKQFVAENKTAK